MSAIQIPKGVIKLPWMLTENDANLTKKDTIANAETEHWDYKVPRKRAIAVREGDRFYLYIATSAAAQITAGVVRLYITDASKTARKHLVYEASPDELDAGGTPEDREKWARFTMGFSLKEDEHLICTVEATSAADDAQLKVRISGVQFLET